MPMITRKVTRKVNWQIYYSLESWQREYKVCYVPVEKKNVMVLYNVATLFL